MRKVESEPVEGGHVLAFQPDHRPDLDALEKKIADFQHSSRTLLPMFIRPHEWLRMKSRWYYKWHAKPNASKVHGWIAVLYSVGAVFTFLSFTLYYSVNTVQAAALTWDGGGADNNWSTCANWSGDTCPVAGDTLTFNGTSTKDSTIDSGFGGSIGSITISSAYLGTITAARSLTATVTTTAFSQSGGTFTSGSQTIDFDGNFVLAGGTFSASSGTTSLGKDVNITSGTFNHNNGTVSFDSAITAGLECGAATFNAVTFANSTSTKTINSTCSFNLGADPTVGGGITSTGTLSGSGTLNFTATATKTFNSGAALSGFSGLVSAGGITISGATLNFGSYTTFDINSTFTLSSGSVTMPAGNATISSAFTISGSPTFNANGGTITFDGSTTATLACNNVTFNLVVFNGGNNTKTVNADCTMPLGNNPTISLMSLRGTLSGTGTLTQSSSSSMGIGSATAAITGFTSASIPSLNINSSASLDLSALDSYTGTNFTNGGTFVAPPSMTLTAGVLTLNASTSFTAPSGNLTLNGTGLTVNSGATFNHNNGTMVLSGGNATFTCSNVAFNLVSFSGQTGSKTVGSGCTFPVGANPTLAASLSLTGTLSGSGTITQTGGTFTFVNGYTLSGFTGLALNAVALSGSPTVDLSSYSAMTTTNITLSNGVFTPPTAGLTMGGALTVSGGTFVGNAGTLDINNVFTLSSGVFTAPSSDMFVSGAVTISGGTFNHNGGTVTFDGSTATISCNNVTFNLVNIANTAGTKTISNNCTMPLGTNPTLSAAGTILVNGTLSGSGTLTKTSATLNMGTGGALSGFSGLSVLSFTVSGANLDLSGFTSLVATGTTTLSSGSLTLPTGTDLNGVFTISGGAFTAPSGSMTLAGALTISGSPTFNHNNGTIVFDGGTVTLACNNVTFNRVELSHTFNALKTINSDCNLPLGANPVVTGRITLNGTLSGTGTLTLKGQDSNRLNTGAALSGFTGLIVHRDLEILGADFDASNYTTFELCDGTALGSHDFTISSGTFTAPSGTMTICRGFYRTGGTFNHNNGTVAITIATSGNAGIRNGSTTFNNVTVTGSYTGDNLFELASGQTQTILGSFSVQGSSTSPVKMYAVTAGSAATIDPRGSRHIHTASVKDITNANATAIAAGNGTVTDLGNNTGWNFYAPTVSSLGPTSVTNGSKITDTTPDFTFTLADSDTNDTVKYQIQVANNATFTNPAIDETSAMTSPSTVTYTPTQALTDGSYYWRVRATDSVNQSSDWAVANSGNVAFSIGESKPVSTPSPTPSPSLEVTDATAETGTTDNPSQRFTVVIRLLDANKQPIAGAKVTLHSEPKETVSDAEGYAKFEDVELGEHTLIVEHNGQIGEQKIAITEDTVANLDPQKEGTISITVELKNVEASPTQSRVIYALYGIAGTLVLLLIALVILLQNRKSRLLYSTQGDSRA